MTMSRGVLEMRWILLALALTFSLSSFSGENKNNHAKNDQQASNTEKRGTDTDPIAIKIIPSPDAKTNATNDAEWRKEKAEEDRKLTWATIILAVVTTFLAIFTAFLWLSTRKLVIGAEKTAQRQLRAFVSPESVDISNTSASGKVRVNIRIKNYGQTPAYKCTCVRRNDIFDFPVSVFPEFKAPPNKPVPSKIDIPPGGFFETCITGMELTQQERSALEEGAKAIYVYGMIEHEDAFGVTRTTGFRYMSGGDSGVSAGAMYACHEGNEAT